MERLTSRNRGNAYYPKCIKEPCKGNGCHINECNFDYEICERLAAYEDTGCTPEEVVRLKKAHMDCEPYEKGTDETIKRLMAVLNSAVEELENIYERDTEPDLI